MLNPEELFQYERGYTGECCLQCPVCGYEYTHPLGAWTRVGSDTYEAGVYEATEAIGVTGERRSALIVAFTCESGHIFALVFQQHKGVNIVTVEELPDDNTAWLEQRRLAGRRLADIQRRREERATAIKR